MKILFAVQKKIDNKHINKPVDSYKLLQRNFSTVSFLYKNFIVRLRKFYI